MYSNIIARGRRGFYSLDHAWVAMLFAAVLVVSPVLAQTRNDLASMRTAQLQIAGESFQVWIAETNTQRSLGLQYVQPSEVAANQGMLFSYTQDVTNRFWMQNTLIALDIAFLKSDGTIIDIQQMAPLTVQWHVASGPYRYALEVLQGTFARLGVQPGQIIPIPSIVTNPPTPTDPSRRTFYQQTMDTNPGWTCEGTWAWGMPTGKGGNYGGPDPTSGYTGPSVYGYNLSGGYTNNMGPASLTTAAIDCSNQTGVRLRFRRWLCIESSQYDHASIQASNNGTTWTTVWNFSGPTLIETAWSLQDIDVSSVADNQPAVYFRWVMGPADVGINYGGWNIDDVELTSLLPVNAFYRQTMDTNPGWIATGAWAWGVPAGNGGDHGGADPKAGYTSPNVHGYNLSGGYANNMTPAYLTTTALNCSGQTGVHLRFRRWLCIESSQYDHASVQVSSNGTTWTTVWNFSGATLIETAWSLQDVDISSVADNQPTVYLRWVMGPTDVGWSYGGWNIDDVELTSLPPVNAFYRQTMDVNPGWTTTGTWAWGMPTGKGGNYGGPDPTSGYTGSNVYGYNLSGGYTNNMAPAYLTTTSINCFSQTGVRLRFRRWLCIESSQYDHASIQASNNGTTWTTVWNFSGPTLIETSWSLQDVDISSLADNQPTVYIRWVMGPADVGINYGGWNIDDVELTSLLP